MSYVCFRVVDSPDKSEKFEVNRREGKKEKKKKRKKKMRDVGSAPRRKKTKETWRLSGHMAFTDTQAP